MQRLTALLVLLLTALAAGTLPAEAATISVVELRRERGGFSLNLVLNLAAGQEASRFEGTLEPLNGRLSINESGPGWSFCGADPLALCSEQNQSGIQTLLRLGLVYEGEGRLELVLVDASAERSLEEPPFVSEVPISNTGQIIFSVVPEPTTALLVAIGLASLAWSRRRASP